MRRESMPILITVIVLFVMAMGNVSYGAGAADFYKGKVVECVVPYKTGGGYDLWMRSIAPFFKKYSGATMVIKNVPGAGSLMGTNRIYAADPNGLTMGILNGPGTMQLQLTDFRGIKYDMAKYTWLCRLSKEQRIVTAGTKSKYKTLDAMQKATAPVKFGTPGVGSSSLYETVLIAEALDIKIDMITGYETANEVTVAIIRGEIDAQTGSFSSLITSIENGDQVPVLQYGDLDMPALAKTPDIAKIKAKTKEKQEMLDIIFALNNSGRGIVAPPGLASDKAKFLEGVMNKCVKDPKFLEIAKKQQMEVSFLPGAEAQKIAQKGLSLSPALKKKFKDVAAKYMQ